MHLRTSLAIALTLLANISAPMVSSRISAQDEDSNKLSAKEDDLSALDDKLRALDGEWLYVEDRTDLPPEVVPVSMLVPAPFSSAL